MGAKTKQPAKPRNRGKKALRTVGLKPDPLKPKNDEMFGFMAGPSEIVGDMASPLPESNYWNPAKNLKK